MNIDVINIVYIDDSPETELSRYLDSPFSNDYKTKYEEIRFSPAEGYRSLLSNPKVREANIILIDSLLFENRSIASGMFTGEEFMFVLRRIFPFIETIIISQNDLPPNFPFVKKHSYSSPMKAPEYYDQELKPAIERAIENIGRMRFLASMVQDNVSWDEYLKDKVLRTLDGYDEYDDLTKEDLDNIIESFRKIQEALDND